MMSGQKYLLLLQSWMYATKVKPSKKGGDNDERSNFSWMCKGRWWRPREDPEEYEYGAEDDEVGEEWEIDEMEIGKVNIIETIEIEKEKVRHVRSMESRIMLQEINLVIDQSKKWFMTKVKALTWSNCQAPDLKRERLNRFEMEEPQNQDSSITDFSKQIVE